MNINSLIVIFSLLLFTCSNGENGKIKHENNQFKNVSTQLDTVSLIKEIRKQYSEININSDHYDKVEKDIMGQSAEGGNMIAYYDNVNLKKIIAIFYGETGQTTTEYYFNTKSQLFFAYSKTNIYDKPIYIKGSKIKSVEEKRYYFFNNKLFKWLVNNNASVNFTSKSFKEESKYIIDDIAEIRKNIRDYFPSKSNIIQGDTIKCKYGSKCLDSGFIIKGSRDTTGKAKHVRPKNKKVSIEK